MNKINLMYKLFGRSTEYLCRECDHFQRKRYGSRTYRKCEVYGNSNSEGTDWVGSNAGCGLAPGKPYTGRPVVELVRCQKQPDGVPEGQMSMF